jgi:predicted ATPase
LYVEAQRALGVPLFWLGEVSAALERLELGAAAYVAPLQRLHASVYGIDPGVVCQSYAALALWQLGRPRQALDRSNEALKLARDLSHPQSSALARGWGAWLRQLRREPRPTREHAEVAVALCTEQGFPLWLSMAVILRGWALAEEDGEEEGIAEMRQGLADLRATGAGLWRPSFLALLAKAHGKVGRITDGLGLLDEALATASKKSERAHEAELHRVRGELLLRACGSVDEAEVCFREALAVARRQEARSFELRAATSLARLMGNAGRCTEAYRTLDPVLACFTEGFSTADLQEAKNVLEGFAPSSAREQRRAVQAPGLN